MNYSYRTDQRRRVAQEAAELLYTEQEKEYKQAKLQAGKNLNLGMLPSNAEVARELDLVAEEREGKTRRERLILMRHEALKIMQILKNFNPIVVGSVWRGTVHRNSDIDIITYAQKPREIVMALKQNGITVTKTEVQKVTKKGAKQQSEHIYLDSPLGNQAEIVVHSPMEMDCQRKCEIYGDVITGLTIQQLREVLEVDPEQKFVPTL